MLQQQQLAAVAMAAPSMMLCVQICSAKLCTPRVAAAVDGVLMHVLTTRPKDRLPAAASLHAVLPHVSQGCGRQHMVTDEADLLLLLLLCRLFLRVADAVQGCGRQPQPAGAGGWRVSSRLAAGATGGLLLAQPLCRPHLRLVQLTVQHSTTWHLTVWVV